MSDEDMKKNEDMEPSEASLREIPEIDFTRVKSLGRGVHARRLEGDAHVVPIESDLWPYFGSAEAVNGALRALVDASKRVRKLG